MNHPTGDISANSNASFNKPPLVSIITVVYNGSKHLAQAIESVLAQTYERIEYIVIDGGSNDGSVDIIQRYQSRLAYWVSEKDRGISHAFNKGIGVATGDIIGILNADDWYEPTAVETAVRAFAPSIGVVSGGLQCWLDSKKDFIYLPDEQKLHREMTVNHPASFVRRSIYQQEGGYQERYKLAMDYDVMLRFKLKGVKFHTVDSVLTNQRLMGVSDRSWLATRSECLAIKNQLLGRRLSHYLYFWRSVSKLLVRKAILRLNGERWVAYYRERYSVVKKVKQ
jgi:glycosyltransferase involved in cell wall biosynthesis